MNGPTDAPSLMAYYLEVNINILLNTLDSSTKTSLQAFLKFRTIIEAKLFHMCSTQQTWRNYNLLIYQESH